MSQRNSANINYASQSEAEKAAFLDYVRIGKPTTALVMDGPVFAEQVYQTAKSVGYEIVSIYRRYLPEDDGVNEGNLYGLWSPEEFADYATENGTVSKNLWIYLLNEPVEFETSYWKELSHWLVLAAAELIRRGYRVIVGNIGSAVLEPHHISEGGVDELLRAVSKWSNNTVNGVWKPLALWGAHEYTAIMLPFGVGYITAQDLLDRNKTQPEQWPTSLPVALIAEHWVAGHPTRFPKYWHLKRYSWLHLRCDELGIARCYFVFTEYGMDRMPDISISMPNIFDTLQSRYGANGHRIIRGHDSCAGVYTYYWGARGWGYERSLFESAKVGRHLRVRRMVRRHGLVLEHPCA